MPTSKSKIKCIGITLGDPRGIGPEVVAKALRLPSIRKLGEFRIIRDRHQFCKEAQFGPIQTKLVSVPLFAAQQSLSALHEAVRLLKSGEISALVTGPVCKEAIRQIEPTFQGHTEFLADAFGVKNVGMLFVADNLRTIIVTRHIPLKCVPPAIKRDTVFAAIQLTHQALRNQFRIRNPKIAVCGLNPHAGEGGTIGQEEITQIIPAIQKARQHKIRTEGPFAADTLFSPKNRRGYDAIVAMYHDQGLIPVKTVAFAKAVNVTIGLPFVRTSPAHGTAFDIAGKNKADPSSMCEAIKLAAKLLQ